ncbi:EVE domain-containing protein [Neisseria sp.]|uniref:EVE domain-containing protein n=1 Tax=Neisseria sp. TaxID=192066 RepID=UPI0035A182B3
MKYWVGTVSKEHVLLGKAGGFCQVCHGKSAPLNRMKKGDWLLYYSPKTRLEGGTKHRSFTAFGQITDDKAYPFRMSETFVPYRRDVDYADTYRDCPIEIVRSHPEWKKYAGMLRYGHFEISEDFFRLVQTYMQTAPDDEILQMEIPV